MRLVRVVSAVWDFWVGFGAETHLVTGWDQINLRVGLVIRNMRPGTVILNQDIILRR